MKKISAVIISVLLLAVMMCGCSETAAVSDSDAAEIVDTPVVWEQEASDEDYMAAMNVRMGEFISCMTTLTAMERRLTAVGDAEKIAADEQYAAVAEQLGDWCEGARSYPAGTLINDRAKTVCAQSVELAGATELYLEVLPSMLAGTYEGELSSSDYQNSIVESAVAIYQLLMED